MKKLGLFVMILCLGALLLEPFAVAAPQQSDEGQAPWEHLAMPAEGASGGLGSPEVARKINEIGRAGWELVDVETYLKDGSTEKSIYFFKRRKKQ